MFFCIMAVRNVRVGEVTVLKRNVRGEVCCYLLDGTYVGYLCGKQPDGCMSFWDIVSDLGASKILCTVAIKANRLLIMNTQSKVFAKKSANRVEVEGYGMMVSA